MSDYILVCEKGWKITGKRDWSQGFQSWNIWMWWREEPEDWAPECLEERLLPLSTEDGTE